MISSPSIPPIPTPPAPPQPPILTTTPPNARGPGGNSIMGFGATIQGNTNPSNTGSKTLLGQ